MITVPMQVSAASVSVPVSVTDDGISISVGIGAAYTMVEGDPYGGPYTVTPGRNAQVLETRGKIMTENVTVEPIPQNYGLVTWNGSILTIS